MDLQVKDVAELLNVSEETIEGWLEEGKIPSYRLNQQYRFSRAEIEDWMISRQLHSEHPSFSEEKQVREKGGTQQFMLYRAIHQGDVLSDILGHTKKEIICATTQALGPKLGVDAEILAELLLDREQLMSTALNNGIAVPHTRDLFTKGPYDRVVVVFPEKPIPYDALDGQPVHTLFFLFACSDKSHLHLLSKIAHLCNRSETLDLIAQKPDKKAVLEMVRQWEAGLLR